MRISRDNRPGAYETQKLAKHDRTNAVLRAAGTSNSGNTKRQPCTHSPTMATRDQDLRFRPFSEYNFGTAGVSTYKRSLLSKKLKKKNAPLSFSTQERHGGIPREGHTAAGGTCCKQVPCLTACTFCICLLRQEHQTLLAADVPSLQKNNSSRLPAVVKNFSSNFLCAYRV